MNLEEANMYGSSELWNNMILSSTFQKLPVPNSTMGVWQMRCPSAAGPKEKVRGGACLMTASLAFWNTSVLKEARQAKAWLVQPACLSNFLKTSSKRTSRSNIG